MARDYARIMTNIWQNREFCQLGEPEQRGYLLLVTQPDISAAGVLALRMRRWADMSSSSSVESFADVLKRLEETRFIVVDWDAEEVLVRSFIRWDGGYTNMKRKPAIRGAADEVRSSTITRHLIIEFRRCGMEPPPEPPPDRPSDAPSDTTSGGRWHGSSETSGDLDRSSDPFVQVDAAPDRASMRHPIGRGTSLNPQPTTLNPQPAASGDLGGGVPDSTARDEQDPPRKPRCEQHRGLADDDPGPNCVRCRDARLAGEARTAELEQAERDRRASLRGQRDQCPHCDEGGWRLTRPGGPPLEPAIRCGHRLLGAIS